MPGTGTPRHLMCGNFFALLAPRILKWLLDCCGNFRVSHFGFTDVLGCFFEAEIGHACRCLYNKLSYTNVHCIVSFHSLTKMLCLCISNTIGKYLVLGCPRFSSWVTETDVCVCFFCCCWIITVEPFLCKQQRQYSTKSLSDVLVSNIFQPYRINLSISNNSLAGKFFPNWAEMQL